MPHSLRIPLILPVAHWQFRVSHHNPWPTLLCAMSFSYSSVTYTFYFHNSILSKMKLHEKVERATESEKLNSAVSCVILSYYLSLGFWCFSSVNKDIPHRLVNINEIMSVKCPIQCVECRCCSVNVDLPFPCIWKRCNESPDVLLSLPWIICF